MTPHLPEDFVDFVRCLREQQCDFVIVGAHAIAAHGAPRATGDLDVFVRPDRANAARVLRALVHFGAPVEAHGVTIDDFVTPGTVYQIGLPPNRIDVITEISGVSYEEASTEVVTGHLGSEIVRCIGLDALIRNKRAAARPKDLADVATLQELRDRVERG
jgi:S1-C subfamily serine protease